jgi:HD superfamily phosphohydrolase YqeK
LVSKYEVKQAPNIKTLHGLAGARYVKKNFNIKDLQILRPIACHVMPPVHTSKAIMIIYIADKLQKKKNQF